MSENLQKYRFLSRFLPGPDSKRLVLITGARQTGKTTLARSFYRDLAYINLDAPENRERVREISSSMWHRDIGNAIIDEAQKEPIVFDKVKYAFDGGQISFEVLLGSSQIRLLKKIRESLAGRVSIFELWPLLMSEIAAQVDTPEMPLIDRLFSGDALSAVFQDVSGFVFEEESGLKKQAEAYLMKWGGMPALLHLSSDDERMMWLRDYEYTYLERDLADLARLDDLLPFRKLQKLAALRSASLLNYSEIARDAGLSVDTARRYLQYLDISYQVVLLQPYYRNLTSSVVKTPKLYWLDIGLLRTLTGLWGKESGSVFETMVVGEIIKWMRTTRKNGEIYFYRTRAGMEMDVLLQLPQGFIGMEIKNRNNLIHSDMKAMKKVARSLNDQWLGGMVVYRGDRLYKVAEPDIWAVPSWRLFA
ncbi:MAG: ATP-binding protein [candidate division KSB1 bacterium]|nr:ATP-binding protein [candidate division KSB1 bacterium]